MQKIENWLKNLKTGWQWQKGFFSITILRYLVTWFAIVPIIAKIFSSFQINILSPTGSKTELISDFHLSSSLQVLWLSSLFFVAALLLYQFCCPWFIKTYNSYSDYKKFSHSPRWIVYESLKVLNDKNELPNFFDGVATKKYVEVSTKEIQKNQVIIEQFQSVVYFKYQDKIYSLAMPRLNADNSTNKDLTEIAEREIFWEIFGRFSSSKRTIRRIIVGLLVVSGLLFMITLVEHIYYGIVNLF